MTVASAKDGGVADQADCGASEECVATRWEYMSRLGSKSFKFVPHCLQGTNSGGLQNE